MCTAIHLRSFIKAELEFVAEHSIIDHALYLVSNLVLESSLTCAGHSVVPGRCPLWG